MHWVTRPSASSAAVVGLREALVRVTLDEDLETAVPCVDWALATGRLDRLGFERFLLALPVTARCIRDWVDPKSQSVLESVARVRLLRRGWEVRAQVRVGDLQAIDLVVADTIALETDGRAFHESSFETDRRKDLQITVEGRHCLRVSYSLVVTEWPLVELAIERALLARGVPVRGSVVRRREPSGSRSSPRAITLDD